MSSADVFDVLRTALKDYIAGCPLPSNWESTLRKVTDDTCAQFISSILEARNGILDKERSLLLRDIDILRFSRNQEMFLQHFREDTAVTNQIRRRLKSKNFGGDYLRGETFRLLQDLSAFSERKSDLTRAMLRGCVHR